MNNNYFNSSPRSTRIVLTKGMCVLTTMFVYFQTQIDRLTNVVEAKLAQNINQIMQRDRIWQTLTNNFQSITKNVFDSTFNDIFMNSVFPRCQTAVQEMLTQVNETFRNGTRECKHFSDICP